MEVAANQGILAKLYRINEWYSANTGRVFEDEGMPNPAQLAGPAAETDLQKIEAMTGELLPAEVREILMQHNGQVWNTGFSPFFEQTLMNTDQIIELIEFGLSLAKPEKRQLKDPALSDSILKKIVQKIIARVKEKDWHHIVFENAYDTYSPPLFYMDANGQGREVKIKQDELRPLVRELHHLEKESYDWDDIRILIAKDGSFKVERSDYNWDELVQGSIPAGRVRKKYFHWKWVPLFHDEGGNYIGIDLDPDTRGVKGQVIIYGRDVDQNMAIAENLEALFDRILAEIEKGDDNLLLQDKRVHFQERLQLFISK